MHAVSERIKFEIGLKPGQTSAELGHLIFGLPGYERRVEAACQIMMSAGDVEQQGSGVMPDDFTFHPATLA